MKALTSNSLLILILTASMLFITGKNIYPTSSTSEKPDINYNISTNNLYFPGDEIAINLYSYDYTQEKKNQKVSFKIQIYKINNLKDFYSKQTSRYNIDVLGRDSTNLTFLADEVAEFTKNIKSKNDYGYYYINESIPINITERGAYLIKVSAGNKVAYCGFIVSQLGVISKAGNTSMLAFVVDRKTGKPISNADLNFFIGSRQIGQGYTSDGLFYQEVKGEVLNANNEYQYPLIIGQYGEEIVISDPYLYFGYSRDKFNTYVFTNQPVYRTESEVLFKGTIKRRTPTGYESYSDKDITVKINDSRGAEVYKKLLRTNDIGSFDGEYKIDKEAPLGTYYIYVTIDENNSSSSSFTVEQFKKPEYKVTVTTDKSQYYGKDNLTGTVEANYFFGSPVTGADVEYNIYRVRYYQPWWKFSEYAWWYEDYYSNLDDNYEYSGAEYIYSGEGTLDEEGKFEFNYTIDENFEFKDEYYRWWWYDRETDYRYIIQAKVVDKSRREIAGTTTAFVTRGGFYLNGKADKYLYKPGEKVNIEVRSFDFSDKPVQTEFTAEIYKRTWSRDWKENKDYITTISGRTMSDGKGIITYDIGTSNAEGSYTVEIKAKDDRSNEITSQAYFYVSEGDMWWYYNQSGGIQIITDKDSYRKGDICKALIITTVPDANVLVSTQSDDILYYKADKFTGTSKMIEIPITDRYISSFEISVNYVSEGQFYSSSKPLMVIPEENFLTVEIDPSKLIYKPKESGGLKVRVLDNNGNPVRDAEVSIGIIDESIYSIKEDNTKDIRKFFYGPTFTAVSTAFNTYNSNYGYSRLMTIYERFNVRSTKDNELATVKGTLYTKNNIPIPNAIIVIDEDFQAATTDENGTFEFKLPEGDYSIGVYYRGMTKDDIRDISLSKGEVKTITLYNDKDLNELYSERQGIDVEQSGRVITLDGLGMEEKDEEAPKTSDKRNGKKEKGKEDDMTTGLVTPDVRSDFRDAIYWSPYTRTDADGYAIVSIDYPDNLTSWRITSRVITGDTKVGQMTKIVITRKDLLVRMETPRFLQDKDEVIISTIIHNYLDKEKTTKVKFKAENVELIGESEKTITLASNSEQRLDWKIKVNEPYGEAKLYAEALTDEESDALEIKVPLQPKGLQIIENTIADFTDENKTEIKTVYIPEGTDIRSAGMQFTVSPSLASTMLSALDELAGYPYGCVEQTMSRFLPTVVVAHAFKELNAPINEATEKELPKMVEAGLNRLYGFQHSDGGWGWWRNDGSRPFMTAYVVYGLSLAKAAGYNVKSNVISNGITAMKNHLKNVKDMDPTTKAYLLYSLAVAEERDTEMFERELDKLLEEEINDYTRGLIAMTYKLIGNEKKAKDVLAQLEKNVKTSGAGAAYWEGQSYKYRWQDDKVQTTAMGLKALVNINPTSDLKNMIIRWLMMQRQGLSWRSTQESAMIIYAMVDYLKTSKELDPNYSVKVYVNGDLYMEKNMTKDDVFEKDQLIKIDGNKLRTGNNEIKIEKAGIGKVYFSANTSYYTTDEKVHARENGFRVEREYYKLEKYESYTDNKITYRKKYFDGSVTTGDMILVKVRVFSKDQNLDYFMLEDPIPAGCEVTKDDWAFTIEEEPNYSGWDYYYWRWWYADKDIRDNRVTFFATYMYGDEQVFSYIMRAQIPGIYNVNPSKGMLMYYTEVNGSSNDTRLLIEDK
ncbi:MAG: carboxypeptidase regulatory-like domain-containing protein [Ignavibacteria bacterium]|nr:carboxypeptidase regulatory-like domain-containing protein [Ignavibacteria bacterium]